MNEAKFKSLIKKSVKAQGGFALSLSAPMVSGLPDLYVAMPGFIPILLEVKWLQFGPTRKIPITPIQRKTLEWCNKGHQGSAFILCGAKIENKISATLLEYNATHIPKNWPWRVAELNIFNINLLFGDKITPNTIYYE